MRRISRALGTRRRAERNRTSIPDATTSCSIPSGRRYKHTTIGFLADVKDMPNQYAYSKTFFDRWYRPENCSVVVAGDVDHDALVRLVRKDYGGWERGKSSVADANILCSGQ